MSTTRSADGTMIAYETMGSGPPLILIDGAMCYRASGPMRPIATQLAPHLTIYLYDRRGRGESGNTLPYAPEREIEDIAALLQAAGGSAFVFGISSGAALALEAANRLDGVEKLALYEAPFVVDDKETPLAQDFRARMNAHLAEGRPGEVVKMFMQRVRVPGFALLMMRLMPVWKTLTGIAHTLPYDIEIVEDHQRGRPLAKTEWPDVRAETLVIDGGKSPVWMRNAQKAIAEVLPNARYATLPGQTHLVKAEALAPTLIEFFGAEKHEELAGAA
jgi:pimeloyl-ACP methyl ester carboxylesterase